MTTVPTFNLNNAVAIPQIGFGTYPLNDHDAARSVATAIDTGYRLIDTAAMYGNEHGVGEGLRASHVARSELFVTTKLRGRDHGYDSALAAFDASAQRLGLDYVDLYLIHWPLPRKGLYVDTWRALIKLAEDGRVRAIGVSNFKDKHIDRLIDETGVTPAVNQIQLYPELARVDMRSFHIERGVVTESWSPLGKGVSSSTTMEQAVIAELATQHDKTTAQIVLRWHVQHGLVAIPKTANPTRMAENIDVFDFELSDEDMAAIDHLDRGDANAIDSDVFDED